jgi:ketol-acid reductoisomerase
MTTYHWSNAIDKSVFRDKLVAVIGYGNQGRSQALNLRDSGVRTIVGNIKDDYAERAASDGFSVYSIDEACRKADIICMLIPDEVQPEVYEKQILPHLMPKKVLDFASGYNVHFNLMSLPKSVDVILVAPKMIGAAVRTRYVAGDVMPCLTAVHQDASGNAHGFALALAAAIGGAKGLAIESNFKEETITDLFAEHAVDGPTLYSLLSAYEVLVEAGFNPEVVLLELYQSGESMEVMKTMIERGLMRQIEGHSTTSQFGQLTRGRVVVTPETKRLFKKLLVDIEQGDFANEWADEMKHGYPLLSSLKKDAFAHQINEYEDRLRRLLRGQSDESR